MPRRPAAASPPGPVERRTRPVATLRRPGERPAPRAPRSPHQPLGEQPGPRIVAATVDHLDTRPAPALAGARGSVTTGGRARAARAAGTGRRAAHGRPVATRPLDHDVHGRPGRRPLFAVGLVVGVEDDGGRQAPRRGPGRAPVRRRPPATPRPPWPSPRPPAPPRAHGARAGRPGARRPRDRAPGRAPWPARPRLVGVTCSEHAGPVGAAVAPAGPPAHEAEHQRHQVAQGRSPSDHGRPRYRHGELDRRVAVVAGVLLRARTGRDARGWPEGTAHDTLGRGGAQERRHGSGPAPRGPLGQVDQLRWRSQPRARQDGLQLDAGAGPRCGSSTTQPPTRRPCRPTRTRPPSSTSASSAGGTM